MYTLKSTLKRGTNLAAAIALAVGAVVPAVIPSGQAFADSLNPLTERSLTLSSSSPGWSYTDGSGNSTYAPPNSGANGQKTGNTFSFKTSSDTSGTNDNIKTMTFQYCTGAAGKCQSPGNDTFGTDPGTITTDTTDGDVTGTGTSFDTELAPGAKIVTAGGNTYTVQSVADATHMTLTTTPTTAEDGVTFDYRSADDVANQKSDLNVVTSSPSEVSSADFGTVVGTDGNVKAVPGYAGGAAASVTGNFVVYYDDGGTWTQSTGWSMTATNVEDAGTVGDGKATGANNYIILTNSAGMGFAAGTQVKVVFFGTDSNYITNPGNGYFFVKINTYKVDSTDTDNDLEPASDANVIDGGVTVANVMNQSIQITTKVLETMEFSVGTVDPDTLSSTGGASSAYYAATGKTEHKPCDIIQQAQTLSDTNKNVLQLGNQDLESSLATDTTYATHSYWRLSSNSSAGATVYYSGHTLTNTEDDDIDAIGATATTSHQGSEQFGLAIDSTSLTGGNGFDDASYGVDYSQDRQSTPTVMDYENGDDNGLTSVDNTTLTDNGATYDGTTWDYSGLNGSFHMPQLDPLVPATNYADGSGSVNDTGALASEDAAKFAFDPTSDTIPVSIATESDQVVDCVTAKMRYIANIAATTPAGIYTTKVNYIAAPQY